MKNTARFAMAAALGAVLLSGGVVDAQRGDSATQAQTLADSIRRSMSPAKWKALEQSATKLTSELSKIAASPTLTQKIKQVTSAAQLPTAFRASLEQSASAYVTITGERDPAKAAAAITALVVAEAEQRAQAAAAELQRNNDAKAAVREEIAQLRDVLSAGSFPLTLAVRIFTVVGCGVEFTETSETFGNKEALEGEISKLDAQLQQLGGCSQQMDQLSLQDAMQKQQQAVQMISNIMKSIHDTLKTIIQNLKA